jgi:hypothetical protein
VQALRGSPHAVTAMHGQERTDFVEIEFVQIH